MTTYLIRRVLLMIPTMFGITLVVFFIMKAAPGDPVQMLLSKGGEMKPGDRKAIIEYTRKRFNLDKPVPVQYLLWLNKVSPIGFELVEQKTGPDKLGRFGFKWPDLGKSFPKNRPVLDLVAESLPITVLINAVSVPIIYILAILTGVYSGRHGGRTFDVVTGVFLIALWAAPSIWVGVMLQGYLANHEFVQAFPTSGLHDLRADQMAFLPHTTTDGWQRGWLLDIIWHLVLPVICMTYGGFAYLSKLNRGAVLDNIRSDFTRTARAKGVSEKDILWHHVFRNSLIPLLTVAASLLPAMIGGSIIVESIFTLHGMGKLMLESIELKDQEVVMAVTLASGVLSMFGFLVADVLYVVADPRISYE
ncbi:MAG: ABC transporter permease subunit [Phycisphaera sp.]|nr:ABC transporter permease subunit [Phycisphaera sp.]